MPVGSSGRQEPIAVSTVTFAAGCSLGRHHRRTKPESASAAIAAKPQGKRKQECSFDLCGLGAPAASSRRRGHQAP
nr:MAG TPA: hypothetical protein [Caudoviricetes sp.]